MELWISMIALIISVLVFIWDSKYRYKQEVKSKILNYILQFYQPTYILDHLPTTRMIIDRFNKFHSKVKEEYIIDLLIELNLEEKIQLFSSLSTSFDELRWAPNLKYS